MQSSDVLGLMRHAAVRFGRLSKRITFDENLSVNEGFTTNRGYGLFFRVGTKELEEDLDKDWPIGQAMVPIAGLFHEVCGHGMQIGYEFSKDTPLSSVLALNYYACHESPAYYGGFDNVITKQYLRHPHEIAAQYAGIREVHDFLSGIYGKDEADHMVLEYEKLRTSYKCEFINHVKDNDSVDDILGRFDRTFQSSIYRHRQYDVHVAGMDVLHKYAHNYHDRGCIARVMTCQDGLKQDAMMTAVYLMENDPNDRIRELPALRGMNLYPDHVFKFGTKPMDPKPKPRDLTLRGLGRLEEVLERTESSGIKYDDEHSL